MSVALFGFQLLDVGIVQSLFLNQTASHVSSVFFAYFHVVQSIQQCCCGVNDANHTRLKCRGVNIPFFEKYVIYIKIEIKIGYIIMYY